MRNIAITIAFVLLLVSSGCTETQQNWFVKINGDQDLVQDVYRFGGEFVLEGMTEGVTLRNVTLLFVGEQGSIMAIRQIGTINETRWRARVNLTVNSSIEYVVPRIGEIDAPEGSKCKIMGLERRDSGLRRTGISNMDYGVSTQELDCQA